MTTFADLKVGDAYILSSEDEPDLRTSGKIVELSEFNGTIRAQFDDELGTYTWGKAEDPIHWFMEKNHD